MRPGIGQSLIPSFTTIKHVHADQQDQRSRNHENVQRKKSRKRGASNDRPAEHHFHNCGTHDRHATSDGGADAQSPIGILIKAQHLSTEGHAQGHQQ